MGEMAKMDWGANRVAVLPEFKSAEVVLELGAGDFSRTLALAQRNPDKRFVTSDYEFSEKAIAAMGETASLPNVTVTRADAHALDFRDELFDFVFSIALMEHIPRPVDALNEVHRVLRTGGTHWFIQAPFWSCAKGHHFMHWDESVLATIPTYGHLYLNEEEMRTALEDSDASFDIEHCLQRIYHREDLSRLTRDETQKAVEQSPFELKSWVESDCTAFDAEAAEAVMDRLNYSVTMDEMRVSGATVLQRKVPKQLPRETRWQRLKKAF